MAWEARLGLKPWDEEGNYHFSLGAKWPGKPVWD